MRYLVTARSQLVLLLWKHYSVQKRQPCLSACTAILPLVLILCLVAIRSAVPILPMGPVVYPPFRPSRQISDRIVMNKDNRILLYAPEDPPRFVKIMHAVSLDLKTPILGFPTEEALVSHYQTSPSQVVTLAAVVFVPTDDDREVVFKIRPRATPPDVVNNTAPVSLRNWYLGLLVSLFMSQGPRMEANTNGAQPAYAESGFLAVQLAVSKAILEQDDRSPKLHLELWMERFPYPAFAVDPFQMSSQLLIPIFVMFSFLSPSIHAVRDLVREKETRLEIVMEIMGLVGWVNWLATYLKQLLVFGAVSAVVSLLLYVNFQQDAGIFRRSSFTLLLSLLMAYSLAMISMSFLVSVFFSTANTASATTGLLFLSASLPYLDIMRNYHKHSFQSVMAVSLFPNTALCMAIKLVLTWESVGTGAQWHNLANRPLSQDPFYILPFLLVLLSESVVFLVLAWYLGQVLPKTYGVPKPWYFPASRMLGANRNKEPRHVLPPKGGDSFEENEADQEAEIRCLGLTKYFGKAKVVDNVFLEARKGRITCLVGHNGAGKTTVMAMVTGMCLPTAGTAECGGHDVLRQPELARRHLGFCPQHNVLLEHLTVEEHLYFFHALKHHGDRTVREADIETMIHRLGLDDRRFHFPHMLSGGMRRRLSLGNALIGNTEAVILDEPSSGLDPAARRFIWDLLLDHKKDKAILLSTQYMQEADVLGDKIAVMEDGSVVCCGSPSFLKKRYDVGQHLSVITTTWASPEDILGAVRRFIPNAEIESFVGAELSLLLHVDSTAVFASLLEHLDDNKARLGIESYDVSMSSMEEVFLKVGEYSKARMDILKTNDSLKPPDEARSSRQPRNWRLRARRLRSLTWKKLLFSWRSPRLLFCQQIVPSLIILLTLYMMPDLTLTDEATPLMFDNNMYGPIFAAYYTDGSDLADSIIDLNIKKAFHNSTTILHAPTDQFKDIESFLVMNAQKDLGKYNTKMLAALSLKSNAPENLEIKVLFNTQVFHAAPLALSSAVNLVYNHYSTDRDSVRPRAINVINHPLPETIEDAVYISIFRSYLNYEMVQGLCFSYSLILASFSVLLVIEKSSGSKHMQIMCGATKFDYWTSTFATDLFLYLIATNLVCLSIVCFKREGLSSREDYLRMMSLFMISGTSTLPCIYVISLAFKDSTSSYQQIALCSIVLGVTGLLTVVVTSQKELHLEAFSESLDLVLAVLLPTYTFETSFSNLYYNYFSRKVCYREAVQDRCLPHNMLFEYIKPCCRQYCQNECLKWTASFYSWERFGIGRYIMFMLIHFVFFTLILICHESPLSIILKSFQRSTVALRLWPQVPYLDIEPFSKHAEQDADVVREKERIQGGQWSETDPLVLKDLTKRFKDFVAVDAVCLGTRRGECFGLLGVNGAGKSSIFKMLAGLETISSGDAFLAGQSLRRNPGCTVSRMGYCPQQDALIDALTPTEALALYGTIKGMSAREIRAHEAYFSRAMCFEPHLGQRSRDLSGGTKRKLSATVALLAAPPVVLLDEPSSGMDPVARRCLWHVVETFKKKDCLLVLSSHCMAECEAVCSRLTILVNGRLCCLGSPRYLRHRFGHGFNLEVKVSEGTSERFQEEIVASYPGAVLQPSRHDHLQYYISDKMAAIFATVERIKKTVAVEEYSVEQMTLEQIFLDFSKTQIE